jgi:hypothetical protein
MKLPAKQKRGGKRRRSSLAEQDEGCDNPAFQASVLEAAAEDAKSSEAVSPPPLPPPRERFQLQKNLNIFHKS